MLNLDNIDLYSQNASDKEAIDEIRRYIYRLFVELDFRLDDLQRQIEELKNGKV